jgi:hypothetical protein
MHIPPISEWCWPALIYAAFAVLSILLYLMSNAVPQKSKLSGVLLSGIMAFVWWYFVMYLCENNHNTWAWVAALAPLLISVRVY